MGKERAKRGGPQLHNIRSWVLQKCNLSDREKGAEQLQEFSVTLVKGFFPFDLSADGCCSQPQKTKLCEEVHPGAALTADLPSHGVSSLTQRRKSFAERLVALFVYPPKPNKGQQTVKVMKVFNQRLPLGSQHTVSCFPLVSRRKNS